MNVSDIVNRVVVWDEVTHPTKTLNGQSVRKFPPKCGGIYVYSNRSLCTVVKIGATVNFGSRLKDLNTFATLPRGNVIFHAIAIPSHFGWERKVSAFLKFRGHYLYGEMYSLSPKAALLHILEVMGMNDFPPPPYVCGSVCQRMVVFLDGVRALYVPQSVQPGMLFIYVLGDDINRYTKVGTTGTPSVVFNGYQTANLSGVGEAWFFGFPDSQASAVVGWLLKQFQVNGSGALINDNKRTVISRHRCFDAASSLLLLS